MKSIVRAMKPLMQILFLITFIIVIYAIIGLELLLGRFHWTCRNNETGEIIHTRILCYFSVDVAFSMQQASFTVLGVKPC